MQNAPVATPKDTQVVSFHNTTDFGFTPTMGCMFDGRAVNGNQGGPGINAGESMILPYHIGHRLAVNLAKIVKLRRAPLVDEANNPVGKPLWSDEDLETLKSSFLKDMYTEAKPVAMSETDRLMEKVEEYRKMVEQLLPKTVETPTAVQEIPKTVEPIVESSIPTAPITDVSKPQVFADKQDVIAELEKRGIKHDKRSNKDNLIKLLS